MSAQFILESPPTQNAYGGQEQKQEKVSPSNFGQPEKALLSVPQQQRIQSKLSEGDIASYIKAKNCQKYAEQQQINAEEKIVEASIGEENHSSEEAEQNSCCSAVDEEDEILREGTTSPSTSPITNLDDHSAQKIPQNKGDLMISKI